MPQPVTAGLLHRLVTGAHAQGCYGLAVAVLVEDDDRILLVGTGHCWEPPSDLVLPGEALDDAVYRSATGVGVHLERLTGYLGHHDRIDDEGVMRTFVFAATVRHRALRPDPQHPCRWAPVDDLPDDLDDDLLRLVSAAPPVNARDGGQAQLAAALRAHARGLLADEAAVELLIAHRLWLRSSDFIDGYVDTAPAVGTHTSMACVDWAGAITALDAGALVCSSGEGRMLRISAGLAEGIPVDLRDALTGLDADNLDLVIQAVLHTGGR